MNLAATPSIGFILTSATMEGMARLYLEENSANEWKLGQDYGQCVDHRDDVKPGSVTGVLEGSTSSYLSGEQCVESRL